jgi:hypothetical protein
MKSMTYAVQMGKVIHNLDSSDIDYLSLLSILSTVTRWLSIKQAERSRTSLG